VSTHLEVYNINGAFKNTWLQPVPEKMELEMLVGMQIEILSGEEILVNWSESTNLNFSVSCGINSN